MQLGAREHKGKNAPLDKQNFCITLYDGSTTGLRNGVKKYCFFCGSLSSNMQALISEKQISEKFLIFGSCISLQLSLNLFLCACNISLIAHFFSQITTRLIIKSLIFPSAVYSG